jgi:hypothetical protein
VDWTEIKKVTMISIKLDLTAFERSLQKERGFAERALNEFRT